MCVSRMSVEVLAKAAEIALPLDFDFAQGLRCPGERFLDRLDEGLDRLLAFLQRCLCALLVAGQVFPRQAQEIVDVLAQLPPGEIVEAPVELFHGPIERDGSFRLDGGRAAPSHPPAGAECRGNREQDDDQSCQVERH